MDATKKKKVGQSKKKIHHSSLTKIEKVRLAAHGKDYLTPDMATRRIKALYNEFLSNNADFLSCMKVASLTWQKPKGCVRFMACKLTKFCVVVQAVVQGRVQDKQRQLSWNKLKQMECFLIQIRQHSLPLKIKTVAYGRTEDGSFLIQIRQLVQPA
ncbi:unnamed protein product [Rhodiola kirilowii]